MEQMTATAARSTEQADWVAAFQRRDHVRYRAWAAMARHFEAMGVDPDIARCLPVKNLLDWVGGAMVSALPHTDDLTITFGELERAFQSKRARRARPDPLNRWLAEQVARHGGQVTAAQIRALLVAEHGGRADHPWLKSPGSRDGEANVFIEHRGKERKIDRSEMAQRLSRARKAWREGKTGDFVSP